MNLRQKYKREKKRNEELKKMVDVSKPNISFARYYPTDVKTICAEEVFSIYYHTPEEYMEKELMKRLCDSIKPFVKFETASDDYSGYLLDQVKCRATLRVLDYRKDY